MPSVAKSDGTFFVNPHSKIFDEKYFIYDIKKTVQSGILNFMGEAQELQDKLSEIAMHSDTVISNVYYIGRVKVVQELILETLPDTSKLQKKERLTQNGKYKFQPVFK